MRQGLVAITFAVLAFIVPRGLLLAADEPDLLPPERWPTSVSAVVSDCLAKMSDRDKDRLRRMEKEELNQVHFGWGMAIRNYYGLWRGNDKLILSACGKLCHPDDASMVIIEAIWAEVRK